MARKGRSREFRELFSLPEDETLVDDYSCALAKAILIQGRMYVSRNYICFFARVIKETKVVIPLANVVSIEKKYTALVVPNAIEVSARVDEASGLVKSYFFASLMNRDATYTLLEKLRELRRERDAASSADTSTPASKDDHTSMFGTALPPTFGLPANEVVLNQFPCVNRSLLHGNLFVTPSYICFDTSMFPGRANKVVLRVRDIAAVKRAQFAKFMPGADHSIQITTKDGKVYPFSGLSERNIAHAAIAQAVTPLGADVMDDPVHTDSSTSHVFTDKDMSDGEDAGVVAFPAEDVSPYGTPTVRSGRSTHRSVSETSAASGTHNQFSSLATPHTAAVLASEAGSEQLSSADLNESYSRKRSSSEPLLVDVPIKPFESTIESISPRLWLDAGAPQRSSLEQPHSNSSTASTRSSPAPSSFPQSHSADNLSSFVVAPISMASLPVPQSMPAAILSAARKTPPAPASLPSTLPSRVRDLSSSAFTAPATPSAQRSSVGTALRTATAAAPQSEGATPRLPAPADSTTLDIALDSMGETQVASAERTPDASPRGEQGRDTTGEVQPLNAAQIMMRRTDVKSRDSMASLEADKVCHRVGQYSFFLSKDYRKRKVQEIPGITQRQYAFGGSWTRLAVHPVASVGSGAPVRSLAEHAVRELAAVDKEFSITCTQAYIKNRALVKDRAHWECWEVHARTAYRSIGVVVLRRKYVPPHASLQQDLVLTLRGAGGLYPHNFLHHLHSVADTISPLDLLAYDAESIAESITKLTATDEVILFAHRDLKISAQMLPLAKVFASRVQTLMEREALKLRGVDESVAQKMPIEDPFEVVEELEQMSVVDNDISPDEWKCRVARYLTMYTQYLAGFRFRDLVDLPSLASCPIDTRQIVLRLLDYFVNLRPIGMGYRDRPLVSKVREFCCVSHVVHRSPTTLCWRNQ
eukprot:TRINITY_DN2049_c0_g1_i1.p1 TRINITY_DN2049_c0_g1~~TRINITY_DN2049_c0_g1_i1.p1  ORF type:complete len:930 (-),score=176.72 TRINITY_DN2049_c0_g1_i1:2337-5126(-)